MSDLSSYEFGDVVWDQFCQSEDHIVPHPIGEEASEQSFLGDSRKKPRHELIGVLGNAREHSNNVCQEKDQGVISVLNYRRKKMLEKHSWSPTPDGVLPSSRDSDSVKEVSNSVYDGASMSSHCFKSNNTDLLGNDFYTTDSILIDKSAAGDINSYDYPLGAMPQTDSDLSFFDNGRNDKDSSDFLYYGWPDIGNFDDVDRMFRSCDSTFGLGASNEDELGWFSSSDAIEGSGNVLKSEFEVSCPASGTCIKDSEKHESIRTNETCSSLDNTSFKNASVSCKNNSWQSDKDESNTLRHMPRKQGVELNSEVQQKISATNYSTTGSSGMTNVHKEQQKNQSRCEAKRDDPYGGSFYYDGSFATEGKELPSKATSQLTLSSGGIQQQKQALRSESNSYLQNKIPYIRPDYSNPSDQTSIFPTLSAVRSDTNGSTNISSKKSSYSSNQVLSAESSHGPAFQVPFCDSASTEKKVQHPGKNFENLTDGEGVPRDFGSPTVQESSSVSSGLNEISLEAASFHQLQLVMEQLDLRTKLCIRDSLYRLARSAEQRNNHANTKGNSCGDDRDASGAEGTNKCGGLMDMETGTNPIDRSIAHLLFHRPSDSSVAPAQHSVSFKSLTQIHGSVSSPPLMPEKSVNDEAVAAESEKNVADG